MISHKPSSEGLSRRELLGSMCGAVAFSAAAAEAESHGPGGPRAGEEGTYDLLIQGGRVVDPSQNLDAVRDVAIRAGKIVQVGENISAPLAREVLPAKGKVVTPGLIEMHTHVFPYVGPYGIEPDPYCVRRGVTTAIDAGTSGAHSFPALRRFVIERAATRVRALLHVVSIGMVAGSTPNMGELEDLRFCDPKLAAKVAGEHRDLIVGLKIRFSRSYTGANDLEGMRRARAAADEAHLPLMIHIGNSFTPLAQLLALMKPGDVVTHSFHGLTHGLLDDTGRLLPEVLEARRRGILFDVGHGAGSFSFPVMEKCLAQDFLPDTISSDLYTANINGPVYDLPTTLSKFMALGLNLGEVVEKATIRPTQVFRFGAMIGTLKPGAEADVSIFELREGTFSFADTQQKTRTGRHKLIPFVTVRDGKLFYPQA